MASTVLRETDPLPHLLDDLVATFRQDGASVIRVDANGDIAVEARAGVGAPLLPSEGTALLPLGSDTDLVLRGPDLRAEDREVLHAFATQLAVALSSRRLQAEAAGATALAKTNELRTALLAAVSHDLRTPLASIKASATSLLAEDVAFDPATTKDLLRTIDDEADRLNSLVGNLLDMSRLQAGALIVRAKPVGLEEIVAAAVVGLAGSRERIDAPTLVERAVANLVENALRYSNERERVRLTAGCVGDRVELRIVDTGPGIPERDRERMFRPFQRLGDNPDGAGVGLGLAVARGFVEAVNGELAIEDTPGGGTTMVVGLPVAAP